MEPKAKFKVLYSADVIKFLRSINEKAAIKIQYNINKCAYSLDKDLFKKHVGTNLLEFRTLYNGIQYRILAFWNNDNHTLVLTTHGFVKKAQKTPQKEIDKAEEIRLKYFNSKK